MNKEELESNLRKLILSYIKDERISKELIKDINPSKVKYILGELEKYKAENYSQPDKELIKDIFFYYC